MDKAKRFFDQFIKEFHEGQGYSDELNEAFSDYLTEKSSLRLVEDHEKKMSAKEMSSHIKKLFKMCEDEGTEKKFLKRLGKAADVDDCSEGDIKKCADELCKEDAKKCDDVIHALEGMVGYEYSDDDGDDGDDGDEDTDKEKVNEAPVGTVITKGDKEYVVVDSLGSGDVQAAVLHNGKPMYRSAKMLNSGDYETTGRKMSNVKRPSDMKPKAEPKASKDDEESEE